LESYIVHFVVPLKSYSSKFFFVFFCQASTRQYMSCTYCCWTASLLHCRMHCELSAVYELFSRSDYFTGKI